jgi:hypothetical protein
MLNITLFFWSMWTILCFTSHLLTLFVYDRLIFLLWNKVYQHSTLQMKCNKKIFIMKTEYKIEYKMYFQWFLFNKIFIKNWINAIEKYFNILHKKCPLKTQWYFMIKTRFFFMKINFYVSASNFLSSSWF